MKVELPNWAKSLAKRWNAETNSIFILSGNIFDIYPIPDANEGDGVVYSSLRFFLNHRLFPQRKMFLT